MRQTVFKYIKRVAIALSVLLNVLLGGDSNQTFSARNWERKRRGLPNLCAVIDSVFYVLFSDNTHCLTSWVFWRVRKDVLHTEEFEKKFRNIEHETDNLKGK